MNQPKEIQEKPEGTDKIPNWWWRLWYFKERGCHEKLSKLKLRQSTQVLDNSFTCRSADSITEIAKILEKTNPGINYLRSRDAGHIFPCSDTCFCIYTHTSFKLLKVPSSGINASVGIARWSYCRLQYSPMNLNTQLGD